MSEEQRELDPTRRMLKVFGVKVTDYEGRIAGVLEQARSATSAEELLDAAKSAIEFTTDLNQRLREMAGLVLDLQGRALSELKTLIEAAAERSSG